MNRPASLAILLTGLASGLAGCGKSEERNLGGENLAEKRDPAKAKAPGSGLGPVATEAPIVPSPVPTMPNPNDPMAGTGAMDKPDATRPGGLPSNDSRKEGARPPDAPPGAPPAAPK